jgi:hypothetical protein
VGRIERPAQHADAFSGGAPRLPPKVGRRLHPSTVVENRWPCRPADRNQAGDHGRHCPDPLTTYLKLVNCSTPTGPRA